LLLVPEKPRLPVTIPDFQRALGDAGIRFELKTSEREAFSQLRPEVYEVASAITITAMRDATAGPGYVLGIIAKDRKRAADIRDGPAPPSAPPKRQYTIVRNPDPKAEKYST
jgi:hypothetical protein